MLTIDGVDIEMDDRDRETFSEYDVAANETFAAVVKQVRGQIDDEDLADVAFDAWNMGHWGQGLRELLVEVRNSGVQLPGALLDRCLESEWGDGLLTRVVNMLRARNRDLAPA